MGLRRQEGGLRRQEGGLRRQEGGLRRQGCSCGGRGGRSWAEEAGVGLRSRGC